MAAHDPADDVGAAVPPVHLKGIAIGAVLMVNVSAVVASAATSSSPPPPPSSSSAGESMTRFVSISLNVNATTVATPVKQRPGQILFYTYNFTLPGDEAAAESINLRVLVQHHYTAGIFF